MENIGKEFFKEESCLTISITSGAEQFLSFIASNYPDILGIYRAIQKQNIITSDKKKKAHKEVQKWRKRREEYKADEDNVTEAQWLELNNNLSYWKDMRDEDDVVYYKNKPLRDNECVRFIFKYPILVEKLDKLDRKARVPIGKGANAISKMVTWPLRKLIAFTMKNSDSGSVTADTAAFLNSLLNSIPKALEEKITNFDPGETSGSNSPEMDEMTIQEVKITEKV